MHISRQDDLIPALADGENHALHAGGGAPNHQERMRRAEGVRRKLLRMLDDRYGMAEIIQRLHRIDIDADTFFAQELNEFRVSASALMPRHVERHHALFSKLRKSVVDWRALLLIQIHRRLSFRRLYPSSQRLQHTKKQAVKSVHHLLSCFLFHFPAHTDFPRTNWIER
ncbi:hypothetical protein SDC9_182095 [bioreactor metagenome]|uniref:Uncharacterized protein n=1 Tax=bioreactor metagenome TaxID=1076179 RepID=A0A645H6F2_9ZZZZ